MTSRNTSWIPSPVTTINDQDAVTFLASIAQQQRLQDPDAAYNAVMYQLASAELGSFGAFLGVTGSPTTPQTKVTFENGTTAIFNNVARVRSSSNFTSVDSGEAFYTKFCNGELRDDPATQSTTSSGAPTPSATPLPVRLMYPPPVAISPQGSLAGYFMNGSGMQDVAVLSINAFEEQAAQPTLTKFLDACRAAKKKKLVIDVQANGKSNEIPRHGIVIT